MELLVQPTRLLSRTTKSLKFYSAAPSGNGVLDSAYEFLSSCLCPCPFAALLGQHPCQMSLEFGFLYPSIILPRASKFFGPTPLGAGLARLGRLFSPRRLGCLLGGSGAALGPGLEDFWPKSAPTWPQVGSQNEANMGLKSIPNSINFRRPLGVDSWWDFHRF